MALAPLERPAPSVVGSAVVSAVESTERAPRFDTVDAFRGIAILLVIVYHAGPLAWRLAPYRLDGWLAWPSLGLRWLLVPPLHFGFSGVHCFFVLSGFCIHLRAARTRAATDGARALPPLGAYFARRFVRIYPPYWIALALFGLALPLLARRFGCAEPDGLLGPPAAASDLALHATMLHTLRPSTIFSINPAFWSLATEEQLYLAWPIAALAIARLGVRRTLLAALLLSLAWRGALLATLPLSPSPTGEEFLRWRVLLHALFLPRWFEWLLGCALAEAVANRRLAPSHARPLALIGAALLAAAMAARLQISVDKLLSDVLFASGWAALLGAALARSAPSPAGAVTRALAAVGRRAYGLYLVHQPLLDWRRLPRLLAPPIALAAGFLFSRLGERPFERWSRRIR